MPVFGKNSVNDGVLGEEMSNAVTQKVDFTLAKLLNHTVLLLFSRQVKKIAVSKVTLIFTCIAYEFFCKPARKTCILPVLFYALCYLFYLFYLLQGRHLRGIEVQ
ncbi:hypothetical protein V5G28_017545 [Scytonema sp. PRP1]